MTEAEGIFVLGALFGMYAVGWAFGHFILVIKQFVEKI